MDRRLDRLLRAWEEADDHAHRYEYACRFPECGEVQRLLVAQLREVARRRYASILDYTARQRRDLPWL